MDNFIAGLFLSRKLILRDAKTLDFKKFSNKRNYELIYGVDSKGFHTFVFIRKAKSKLLRAELEFLDILADDIAKNLGIVVVKRILFFSSALCSKILDDKKIGWKLYDFV